MPVPTGIPDLDRALHLLVHDVRAPLSVAHGYLRLLRERRLASEAERERALAQAAESLGRISQICDDALAYAALKAHAAGPIATVDAAEVFGQIAGHLAAGPAIDEPALPSTASLRVATPNDLVDAVCTVVLAVWQRYRRRPEVRLRASVTDAEMILLVGLPQEWDALGAGASDAFDPWKGGHGLALPRACGVLALAGGRVWGMTGSHATGIALPLEVEP